MKRPDQQLEPSKLDDDPESLFPTEPGWRPESPQLGASEAGAVAGVSGGAGEVRRRTARTRALSSRGLKGLTT